MKMDWKSTFLLALLTAALILPGCAKKAPPPAPPPPPPPEVAPPPPPPPPPLTAEDPKEEPPPPSITELQSNAEREGLLGDVFFAFDKYDLRSDARQRLEKNAMFMKENPDLVFTIEGHCDERGTNEYNLALGQRRSSAALDFLDSLGVGRDRFKTISYGEERPFCTESSEACWQKNRRARFVISGRR